MAIELNLVLPVFVRKFANPYHALCLAYSAAQLWQFVCPSNSLAWLRSRTVK